MSSEGKLNIAVVDDDASLCHAMDRLLRAPKGVSSARMYIIDAYDDGYKRGKSEVRRRPGNQHLGTVALGLRRYAAD